MLLFTNYNVSSFFHSTTTWYEASEMRWASITDNTTCLTINAWSPSDASQAIQQQAHHLKDDTIKTVSEQTWEVTKHQRDVNDRGLAEKGIRHLKKICLCVPSTSLGGSISGFVDLWGDPAVQLLSPQAWSELLMEMCQQGKIEAEKLEVNWEKSCNINVKGFLDALLLVDTQHHLKQLLVNQEGGSGEVSIYNETIKIRDVLEWSRRYNCRVVKVTLPDLKSRIFPGDKALMRMGSTFW